VTRSFHKVISFIGLRGPRGGEKTIFGLKMSFFLEAHYDIFSDFLREVYVKGYGSLLLH
jgi:hypothetical protein